MKTKSRIRILIYSLIVILFFIMVLIRQSQITNERSKVIVSSIAQWQEKGIPVTVKKAELADISEYARLTISLNQQKQWTGFVSKDIKDTLLVGQKIYKQENTADSMGAVIAISDEISIDTGMFCVTVNLISPIADNEARKVVFIQTHTFMNVINIPNDILDIEDGNFYVWKGNEQIARQEQVKIISRNGYGAVVESGIEPGDILIYRGQSALIDGQHIQIINEL